MFRLSVTLGLRTAIATSFICVVAAISGCGGPHTTEAAATDGSVSTRAEASTVSVLPVKSVTAATKTETPNDWSAAAVTTAANTNSNVTSGAATVATQTQNSPKEPARGDEGHRQRILGKWLQENEEKRTITVKEDGTALIVAELNDYRQYIVGKTLEFDVKWTLEDGKLTFITTGGRPAESITYIMKLFGNSRVYRIVEFVEDGLMLKKDETGDDEPKWTRLADN